MNNDLTPYSTLKRFGIAVLIACCLMAQVIVGWHAGKHVAHDTPHCQICAGVAHMDHAGPVTSVQVAAPTTIFIVHYNSVLPPFVDIATLLAYAAQGPPVV